MRSEIEKSTTHNSELHWGEQLGSWSVRWKSCRETWKVNTYFKNLSGSWQSFNFLVLWCCDARVWGLIPWHEKRRAGEPCYQWSMKLCISAWIAHYIAINFSLNFQNSIHHILQFNHIGRVQSSRNPGLEFVSQYPADSQGLNLAIKSVNRSMNWKTTWKKSNLHRFWCFHPNMCRFSLLWWSKMGLNLSQYRHGHIRKDLSGCIAPRNIDPVTLVGSWSKEKLHDIAWCNYSVSNINKTQTSIFLVWFLFCLISYCYMFYMFSTSLWGRLRYLCIFFGDQVWSKELILQRLTLPVHCKEASERGNVVTWYGAIDEIWWDFEKVMCWESTSSSRSPKYKITVLQVLFILWCPVWW